MLSLTMPPDGCEVHLPLRDSVPHLQPEGLSSLCSGSRECVCVCLSVLVHVRACARVHASVYMYVCLCAC